MSAPVRGNAPRRRPRWDSRRPPKEESSPVGDSADGEVADEEVHEPASTPNTGNPHEERTAEHLEHL